MAAVWEAVLDPTAKLLLLRIADVAGERGTFWEAQATIAQRTGLGERTVRRLLAKAVEDGWLIVEKPAQRHRPTEYRLDVAKLRAAKMAGLEEREGGHPRPSRAATVADEPRTEPSTTVPKGTAQDVAKEYADEFQKWTGHKAPDVGQIASAAKRSLAAGHPMLVLLEAARRCARGAGPAAFRRIVGELLALDVSPPSGNVRAGLPRRPSSKEAWDRGFDF